MEILTLIGAAITGGSALGALVTSFFAARQKSLVVLLRESNKDYQDRVKQLETEREVIYSELKKLRDEVDALKKQKTLPLEKLTTLVVEQHSQNMAKLDEVVTAMSNVADAMSKGTNK